MEHTLRGAIALCDLARGCYEASSYLGARRRYEEAIACYERAGPERPEVMAGLAAAWQNVGACSYAMDDDRDAYRCFRRAVDLYRRLENLPAVATVLNNLGAVCVRLGRLEQARAYLERCRRLDEHLGDEAGMAMVLHNLGRLAEKAGDPEAARQLYDRSQRLFYDLGWESDARREKESCRRLRVDAPGSVPGHGV